MKVNELETILNKVGGFTQAELQQDNTPPPPLTTKTQKKKVVKKEEAVQELNPIPLNEKTKKRTRKTKQDILLEMATAFHGEVMGKKYTSTRNRKVLLRFIKIIFPKMKNFQIIDFLLLQALEQNKHLLPSNYMDSILQEDELT